LHISDSYIFRSITKNINDSIIFFIITAFAIQRPEVQPEDFDYPSDESSNEDMECDPNNETKDSDDSDDSLPSSSNKLIGEYESDSMNEEEDRTISRDKTTSHSSLTEFRALTQSICSEKN